MRFRSISGALATVALAAAPVWADDDGIGKIKVGVPNAITPIAGVAQPSLIDPDFAVRLIATGTNALENPSGVITTFGKLATGVNTVPDINTYLKLPANPGGPSSGFNYGRHFLYQGHENAGNLAYITRINLDVNDPAHRITLLTPVNPATGLTGFNRIDGSTFNPFTNTLLFTEENNGADLNGTGRVIQVTLGWPPVVNTLEAFIGLGGYEGIHPDDKGTIYLQEDIGGNTAPAGTLSTIDGSPNIPLQRARQPNSFVYRYVPKNSRRLEDGGKLQVLQVIIDSAPVVFHLGDVIGDIIAPAQRKLHTPGTSWPIKWITIHESKAGDTASFVATSAAKAAGGTPFKRPENMAWLPGSDFRTFFFSATGDTDAPTGQVPQLAARGAWGALFRVDLREEDDRDHHGNRDRDVHRGEPKKDGKISVFILGDQEHTSFDNLAFANEHQLLAAEDRGDTLHGQLGKFDSVWAFDVRNGRAVRFIALGRDPSSAAAGNDNNEPTGTYVSNGSPRKEALLGTRESLDDARGFFTQQHGDNNLYEFFNVKKGFAHK
jgi:hypothetical protein